MAEANRNLPRGRKRAGWKAELLQALSKAAVKLGELSETDVMRATRSVRNPGPRNTERCT